MAKLTDNPQSLKDIILAYTGTLGSVMAAAKDFAMYFVPWLLGISVTIYALYNQHLQAKINRRKLNENDDSHKKD